MGIRLRPQLILWPDKLFRREGAFATLADAAGLPVNQCREEPKKTAGETLNR